MICANNLKVAGAGFGVDIPALLHPHHRDGAGGTAPHVRRRPPASSWTGPGHGRLLEPDRCKSHFPHGAKEGRPRMGGSSSCSDLRPLPVLPPSLHQVPRLRPAQAGAGRRSEMPVSTAKYRAVRRGKAPNVRLGQQNQEGGHNGSSGGVQGQPANKAIKPSDRPGRAQEQLPIEAPRVMSKSEREGGGETGSLPAHSRRAAASPPPGAGKQKIHRQHLGRQQLLPPDGVEEHKRHGPVLIGSR